MSLSTLQAIRDSLLRNFGFVLVSKALPSDPLSESGFQEWEGELARDLIDLTAHERTLLANNARESVRHISPRQDGYRAAILAAVTAILAGWASATLAQVAPVLEQRMISIAQSSIDQWSLAQVGSPVNLTASQEHILRGLAQNQGYYIHQHFGPDILAQVETALDRGLTRNLNAEDLADYLGSVVDGAAGYWPGLVTNALNTARNAGSIFQFESAGVQTVYYSNPQDEKTTPFCWLLAGREVKLSKVSDQLRALSNARTISEVETLAPFVRKGKNKDEFILDRGINEVVITPENIDSLFSSLNLLIPPFHPRCRTLILPKES